MTELDQLYNQAEKLKDDGKNDQAIDILKRIVEQDPAHVLSHLMLCRIYTLTGKYEQAIAHGQKACELEPRDAFNFSALSITYQRAFAGTGDRRYIQLAEDAMAQSRMVAH
jgi:tetratricopeptide (TPR) repeat protein